MTTALTTAAPPDTTRTHGLRRILVGSALVLLLTLAFTVGHLTAVRHQVPVTTVGTIQVPTGVPGQTGPDCRPGHLRGPC